MRVRNLGVFAGPLRRATPGADFPRLDRGIHCGCHQLRANAKKFSTLKLDPTVKPWGIGMGGVG